jgi:hypothetical protein
MYADYKDGGQKHSMGHFCGYELASQGEGLVPQGLDLTAQFNKLVKEHRDVYVGYRTWDNGTKFEIWEVRLEMFVQR